MTMHDVLVWGPAAEGEQMASGLVIVVPGWVWSCSCRAGGYGYRTEAEAEAWAEAHRGTPQLSSELRNLMLLTDVASPAEGDDPCPRCGWVGEHTCLGAPPPAEGDDE